jgi:lipopolysaccharide transport system ATP-binding protein
MSEELAISLRGVSKCFKRYDRPVDRLKELLIPGKSRAQEFWALRDIDLDVPKGQTLGIVGRNGSGKSTLLQIIAGTLTPTTGTVQVNGRVSALLELGSGFNPEFTGRQNVFFNGQLLGLTKGEVEERFDEIAAFADIGDFIDQPVKTYSSGMFVRLAFAVAINVSPDVLIVDEALAVGDARFQQRCMSRINQLRQAGVSILFVSHDSQAIQSLCSYAYLLDRGEILNQGSAVSVMSFYLAFMTVDFDLNELNKIRTSNFKNSDNKTRNLAETSILSEDNTHNSKSQTMQQNEIEFQYFRHGDGSARITYLCIEDENNQVIDFGYLGQSVKVIINVSFLRDIDTHLVGLILRDRLGVDIIAINTFQENIDPGMVFQGDQLIYEFTLPLNIKPGTYSLCPSVAYDQYTLPWMDWIENYCIFKVIDPKPDRLVFGIYYPPSRNIRIQKVQKTTKSLVGK